MPVVGGMGPPMRPRTGLGERVPPMGGCPDSLFPFAPS